MTSENEQFEPLIPTAVQEDIARLRAEIAARNPSGQRHGPPGARLYFDLSEIEGVFDVEFYVSLTSEEEIAGPDPYPAGIIVGTERRYHGADVHLSWEQAKELRDTLTQLLREAGQE